MRSMSKLALLVSAGAPLLLLSSSALADAPTVAPPPAATPAPVVAPAAPPPAAVAPAVTPAPAAAAPPVVAAPPAAAAPAVAAPAGADGLVMVHIQTKELVTLEHRSGPNGAWQVGCETPCDARLPVGDEYRVVGAGVNESGTFALSTPKGDTVKVHVAPALKSRERLGQALTITGAVVTVGALVVGVAASDPGATFSSTTSGATDNYNWNVIAVGTAVALAGLTTAIVGGAFWYDNTETRVAGDVQGQQPARGDIEPRYQTGMRTNGVTLPSYSATLFSTTF